MEMEFNNLIGIGLAVLVAILVIKMLSKLVFRVFGIAIIAVIGLSYLYFYTDYFEEHKDNVIVQTIEKHINIASLKKFEAKKCFGNNMTRSDSIKCECIVQPLLKDLRTKYSEAELDELIANKDLYLKELLLALKRNKNKIVQNLKEREALSFWNTMVNDLKKGKFLIE